MMQDIYDPLTEYLNLFRDRFADVAHETFAQLAQEAHIDLEANRATCQQLYDTQENLASAKSSLTRWTILCIVMWLGVVAGAGTLIYHFAYTIQGFEKWMIAATLMAVGTALLLLILLVHPKAAKLEAQCKGLEETADGLEQTAWQQMEPLNRLYDWDVLTRMMSATVPRLEFDPYFTTQRLADLKEVYGWDDSFNAERSVICSHSGLINGNPFIICRTRKMEMGSKTYHGSKTIHWTTRERGTDGKYHNVQHSQVLTASVTAPYPQYHEKTRLIYGNTAAPDLTFNRLQSGLAGHEGSLEFKMRRNKLRRKSRDLENSDYAMMTNEDFETAFDTSDRNDNQQFALLFTPLAQDSMMKVLKDDEAGYGDDFDFHKQKMINTVISNHMQELDLDMNPAQYRNFDYEQAEKDFYKINSNLFRAIYFALAPLLCIPMYQQIRSQKDIYGQDMPQRSAFWEHEALANFWGQDRFMHPDCVTTCILKTEQHTGQGGNSWLKVYAHGYKTRQRVTYVSRFGGDGRWHKVPVMWDEYIEVTGTGRIDMSEDNSKATEQATSQSQRLQHIHGFLDKENLTLYRRHIASKVVEK